MVENVDLVTVKEAAELLGITIGRVHQLIAEKRLPAEKLGSQFTIKKSDLELVKERNVGRPRKNPEKTIDESLPKTKTSRPVKVKTEK